MFIICMFLYYGEEKEIKRDYFMVSKVTIEKYQAIKQGTYINEVNLRLNT